MPRQIKYSEEELIECIREEYRKTNDIPKFQTKRKINKNTFFKRFGSWKNTLIAAGIPVRRDCDNIRKEIECKQCKTLFQQKDNRQIFCSKKCFYIGQIKPRTRRTKEEWKLDVQQKRRSKPFNELSWDYKRKRIIEEQQNKCKKCSNDTWFEKPLTLEVDHINGNRSDDRKENLEALCPNCHSITETWRGRNKNKKFRTVTDEELLKMLRETKSIYLALKTVGLTPRGGNYKRAYRLLNENDLI